MSSISEFLKQKNIADPELKADKLTRFSELLIEANKKINLTAITEQEEIEVKHFYDSLQAADLISGSVIDIGTGAGFPAIPLAVVREDCYFTLADSLKKRIDFLEEIKKELKLDNIRTLHSRAEDLDKAEKYDFATARAVAKLNILCEYCIPFLKKGGKMLAFKGNNFKEETAEAKNAIAILGARIINVKEYKLNVKDGILERSIIEILKEKETPAIYPRGGNKPRLKPLI